MKKSLLALAVASVALASAAQAATVYDKDGTSLDVYGRVQAVVYSQDSTGSNASGDSTIDGSARLGLDMRTQLTSGIAGFANVEWDTADADQNPDFSNRYLWVGADFGQFGQIKAGRFEDSIKYVLGTTDIFDDWGCVGQAGNDDKRSGNLMYSWSGYGVDVSVNYGAAQDGQHVDGAYSAKNETLDLKNSAGIAAGYTSPDVLFGPIAVKAGYNYTQFQDDAASSGVNGNYDDYSQWAVALSWGNLDQGFYVAGLYQARDFSMLNQAADYTVSGYEFVVAYAFSNGVSIRTGFENQNYDPDGGKDYDAFAVPVYLNYQINPQMNVWAEARFDAGTDNGFVEATGVDYTENAYSVGARYTF